jgi:hypothetical protein
MIELLKRVDPRHGNIPHTLAKQPERVRIGPKRNPNPAISFAHRLGVWTSKASMSASGNALDVVLTL